MLTLDVLETLPPARTERIHSSEGRTEYVLLSVALKAGNSHSDFCRRTWFGNYSFGHNEGGHQKDPRKKKDLLFTGWEISSRGTCKV